MRRRYPLWVVIVLGGIASWLGAPGASSAAPCPSPVVVEQGFPTSGPEETRWSVSICDVSTYGLVIGPTSFRVRPTAAFVQVLYDARVSQIFVPYNDEGPRFYDIAGSRGLLALGDTECPPALGTLVANGRVCVEIKNRGLAWRTDAGARRGEDLVVWGVIEAGNYKYMFEWTFRDDGVILGRVGATGRNLPEEHDTPHSHTVTWRLDVDLGGPDGNSARLGRKIEKGRYAHDFEQPIPREASLVWNDLEFNTLNIYDATLTNGQGKPTSYRLIPLRSGTARHFEAYTQSDFWVTRAKRDKGAEVQARELPSYVDPPESVTDTDIVVWYTGSVHHIPRDEDDGATQLLSVGFTLMPSNLFDSSPLFP